MRSHHWIAGFVAPDRAEVKAAASHLRDSRLPMLLVVDYAETRTEQVRYLAEAAAEATKPVRLLLIARTAGEWWEQLSSELLYTMHFGTPVAGSPSKTPWMGASTPTATRAAISEKRSRGSGVVEWRVAGDGGAAHSAGSLVRSVWLSAHYPVASADRSVADRLRRPGTHRPRTAGTRRRAVGARARVLGSVRSDSRPCPAISAADAQARGRRRDAVRCSTPKWRRSR